VEEAAVVKTITTITTTKTMRMKDANENGRTK